jgi:hypothetical protein
MKLTYEVLSVEKGKSIIKFFYQEGKRYGEFYLRLDRDVKHALNPKSPLGVRGKAEIEAKDRDYAFPLLQGFSEVLEFYKRCDVCGDLFRPDRHLETCNFCWEEIQLDHIGDIEE